MKTIIWLVIMLPCGALFTGIGIYAWRRKTPMHFYSGSTVRKEEITDVAAYNRANGVMWLVFSLPFWVGTVLGCFHRSLGGIVVMLACIVGIPLLVVSYGKIYRKYKK